MFAGGVALNCVANGTLLRQNLFDNIWIQPAWDAGGALCSSFDLVSPLQQSEKCFQGKDNMKEDIESKV